MSIRVTVLGSGTIIPSLERRTTALLLEVDYREYLFDCGPGTLDAVEEAGSSFRSLQDVFFTHFHPDHTLGIGHLLAAINNDESSAGRHTLAFYGPKGLADMVGKWNELYPSTVPKWDYLELHEVEAGVIPLAGGVRVEAVQVKHGDCPTLGYRVSSRGASVVYTGDTEYTEALVELSHDADLLIAECSMPDSRPLAGHLTPSGVGRLACAASVQRVVLVHLYPVFGESDPAADVKKHYKGSVEVAGDGMVIDVEGRGE
jgi:ribonuclease BN (tRNA processing enzyme)